MIKDLRGKKLLVLGGNALSCDIVKSAHDLGVYTIVTDWNTPDKSPAKMIADEYWNISLMDYEQLSKKIKEEEVNGIITGFTDSYLLPYQHLCQMNGMPCYGTKQQFEQTLDKATFKSLCRTNGIDVVPQYEVKDFDASIISERNKIIIKPVDNSGSRGICLCGSPLEYEQKLAYALSFSQKKQVVLERYMECDDVSFEYVIQDGEVLLSSICDRYIYKTDNGGSVTSKLIYPSKYTDKYIEGPDRMVKQMFQNMGLKNGVLFMQAFVESGHFFFYEMGFRLSGGRHYIFTDNQNGSNAAKELINFALTGDMADFRLANIISPKFKNICCQFSVLCKSDIISDVEGKDFVNKMPEVVDVTYYYGVDEMIGKEGTTAQIFARIHFVVENVSEISSVEKIILRNLKVLNKQGDNLVIRVTNC